MRKRLLALIMPSILCSVIVIVTLPGTETPKPSSPPQITIHQNSHGDGY